MVVHEHMGAGGHKLVYHIIRNTRNSIRCEVVEADSMLSFKCVYDRVQQVLESVHQVA